MVAPRTDVVRAGEDLLAQLTTTAYSVALRHGLKAPFIDVELALWRELRRVLSDDPIDLRPDVLWHGLLTVPPAGTEGLPSGEGAGDLRSEGVARSGDRATTPTLEAILTS